MHEESILKDGQRVAQLTKVIRSYRSGLPWHRWAGSAMMILAAACLIALLWRLFDLRAELRTVIPTVILIGLAGILGELIGRLSEEHGLPEDDLSLARAISWDMESQGFKHVEVSASFDQGRTHAGLRLLAVCCPDGEIRAFVSAAVTHLERIPSLPTPSALD